MKLAVLAGLLTLTGVGVLGSGPAAPGPVVPADRSSPFEGTWINEVHILTCPPAPPAVIATLQSMETLLAGGVMIEGGGAAGAPPAVSRSAGHGIWEKTGANTIRTSFRFHSFDNLGRLVRITEVTSNNELIEGDNPATPEVEPYYRSGTGGNVITNLDPVTGAVINVIVGCNESTNRPVLFQDN